MTPAKLGANRLRPWCSTCEKFRTTTTVSWTDPPTCRVCAGVVEWKMPTTAPRARAPRQLEGQTALDL